MSFKVLVSALFLIAIVVFFVMGVSSITPFLQSLSSVPEEETDVVIQSTLDEREFSDSGFPLWFPVVSGAELVDSWNTQSEESYVTSAVWETEAEHVGVYNYYKEQLTNIGWEITNSFESEGSFTFSFEKDDDAGFIGVTKDDEKTIISITLGMKSAN